MPIAIGVIGLAFVAFLAIFGPSALGKLLQGLFSQSGGSIGSWLGDHIVSAVDSVGSWIRSTFDKSIAPLGAFILLIANLWKTIWTQVTETVSGGVEAAQAIAEVTVPHIETALVHDLAALRGDLELELSAAELTVRSVAAELATDIPYVEEAIVADVAGVKRYALDVAQAVGAAGTAALGVAEGELLGSIADASTYAQEYADLVGREVSAAAQSNLAAASGSLADAIAAAREKAVAEAEAYGTAAAAAIPRTLDDAAARAIAGAWGDITGAAARAADAAKGMAGRIPRDLAGIKAAAPAGVAAAVGALAAAVTATMDTAADCAIPNCRNLSGFGNDLKSLMNGLEGGALIGLFIALSTDPGGTAKLVEAPLKAMVDPVVGVVQSLVGA